MEEVQAILKADFQGKPINEQNMTAWKQGGYQDWAQKEDVAELAKELRDRPEGILKALDGVEASDCVATLLSVQLAEISRAFFDKNLSIEERWNRFRKVHEQVSRMRRDDHRKLAREFRFD